MSDIHEIVVYCAGQEEGGVPVALHHHEIHQMVGYHLPLYLIHHLIRPIVVQVSSHLYYENCLAHQSGIYLLCRKAGAGVSSFLIQIFSSRDIFVVAEAAESFPLIQKLVGYIIIDGAPLGLKVRPRLSPYFRRLIGLDPHPLECLIDILM